MFILIRVEIIDIIGNHEICDTDSSVWFLCDPVAGLVEVLCIVRNGLGAVNALAAADMALAGVRSVIPSDEVIDVMLEVGSNMPKEHRETALGGLAQTPTGRKLTEQIKAAKSTSK